LHLLDWHHEWKGEFGMPMTKVRKIVVALLGVTIALGNSTSATGAPTESFDKPLRKKVVNLVRSRYQLPYNPYRFQLSCFYYPGFMVKEVINRGVKGAFSVTVTPVIREAAPPCHLEHASTERLMSKDLWAFAGVKGSLLFLEEAEGDSNGGKPFRVLEWETGKRVFEDSTREIDHLEFLHTTDESVSLRYLRVVGGDCSIPMEGMNCWSKFKKHYGLATATVPRCTGYRRKGEHEGPVDHWGIPLVSIDTASAIDYPVEVDIFPHPSIRAIPGPVKCGPVQ